jgi:ATP-dependent Clp protease ATP-binding subunit ClpA
MLADKGYDSKMGARPLSRKIDELIRVPLSKKILFERLSDCDIVATMADDTVQFEITPRADTVIEDDGIIRIANEV